MARRKAKQHRELLGGQPEQNIKLQNPVSQHFASFIFANSVICHRTENRHDYEKGEKCDSPDCTNVVERDSAKGKHLVLCGAGPSLAETIAEHAHHADHLWGCNSAVTWLAEHGYTPTHGFTVDQTAHMVLEWKSAPDVEYLLASSVHPHLTEYLLGKGRRVRVFHNFVGVQERPVVIDGQVMSYEDWMYESLYPSTVRAGSGLNSVNRAIDVALFMGYDKITVLGADCAIRFKRPCPDDAPLGSPAYLEWLRSETVMHADGGNALASEATPLTMSGTVDGRLWLTKPDMIVSAVWLEKMRQHYAPRIELVGDTLPVALKDKPDSYLKKLPTLTDGNGRPMEFCPSDQF